MSIYPWVYLYGYISIGICGNAVNTSHASSRLYQTLAPHEYTYLLFLNFSLFFICICTSHKSDIDIYFQVKIYA